MSHVACDHVCARTLGDLLNLNLNLVSPW
eukprot:SAG31_NODE_28258_length_413_cov_0.582803_1_plen_28_part_01